MPSYFPSTPFYLNEYFEKHKNEYSSPRKVKIRFIYIEDKSFFSANKPYQKYIEKYRKIVHKNARNFAVSLIKKLKKARSFYGSEQFVFETDFLQRGQKIGKLVNSENIIKFALIQKPGTIFSMPIEQMDGWIIFQTAEVKRDKEVNLKDIALNVWKVYINNGKEVFINSMVNNYFNSNIKEQDIFKLNYSYLSFNREKVNLASTCIPDSTEIKQYYEENIEEFVTVRDTLPLTKVIEDIKEKLTKQKRNALVDSLIDTLSGLVKNNHFSFDNTTIIVQQNLELIQNLPYFTEPYSLIMDTLFSTSPDSVFKETSGDDVYLGRVNSKKKLSKSKRKKLKTNIKRLITSQLYQERKEDFDKYYSANKNNFYKEDSYKFIYLFCPLDTSRVDIKTKKAKKFFLANRDEYFKQNRVRLQTIFLNSQFNWGSKNINNKLHSLNSALEDSIDFSVLAKIYYTANEITEKNDNFINEKLLGKKLQNFVSQLHIGEISNPIKTKDGYYIIKLLARVKEFDPSFEDVKENIIEKFKLAKADSICFHKMVEIYDSLETGNGFEKYDSSGYVDTTDYIQIKESNKIRLDSNVTITSEDFEPLYRTSTGKVIPKIFKQKNGYAIILVSEKIPGHKITNYESYSFAKDKFRKIYKFNECRNFTDYLIDRVKKGNDTLLNFLGGMKRTNWLTYFDKIDNLGYSQIILRDAFSRKKGAYSNPIRFTRNSFGFYHILDKKIESKEDFAIIKNQYREKYIQMKFDNWIENYKREKNVIIY